ncbi:MAG: glycosyltransferase family 4 protein [Candidatus Saccharicenans sp.]|nr:glycosyltransferase family 4 protein [Candidatus Saccharicenans sp.]
MSLCLIASDPQDELELKQFFLVCRELKKKNYPFFILTGPGSKLSSQARVQGIRVINHRLDGSSGWLSSWRLQRLFKKNGIDLVHFFDREAAGSTWKAARKAGIKIQLISWKPAWNLKEALGVLSQVDSVVCENDEAKRLLLKHNLAQGKLEIIPPGLDVSPARTARKDFLRQELNLQSDNFLVGLLCPLEDLKTLKSHLEAVRILDQEAPRLKVVILGIGALNLERLRQEQALEFENLYFYLGFNEQLAEVISALDLFVFGAYSLPEEYILKAMVWRVPVIGVMAAGMTGLIIQRETGLLVAPGDPASLAQAILKLYLDRSLAQSLSSRAFELVSSQHSVEAMAQKMVNHYEFLALQKGVKLGR